MAATTGPNVGQSAPAIDLLDAEGQRWRLSDARGRVVVLMFYPADETPTCTAQMCSVRDNWPRYLQTGAEVIGINMDSVASHKRFAEHHSLPFRLLADPDGGVVRAYDMKLPLVSKTKRGIVVIDKDGIVRFRKVVFPMFRPGDDEVLEAIRQAM